MYLSTLFIFHLEQAQTVLSVSINPNSILGIRIVHKSIIYACFPQLFQQLRLITKNNLYIFSLELAEFHESESMLIYLDLNLHFICLWLCYKLKRVCDVDVLDVWCQICDSTKTSSIVQKHQFVCKT